MRVSKQQIVSGIVRFAHDNVISGIPDVSVRTIVGAVMYGLRNNPNMLDKYIGMLPCENGLYDIAIVTDSLSESIKEYGNLSLTIPAIPLILPTSKTLSFSSSDVETIVRYIEESCTNG